MLLQNDQKEGLSDLTVWRSSPLMPEIYGSFDSDLAYDQEGNVVIRSTCRECGESKLVCVRDGSLAKWESQHTCTPVPKMPSQFSRER
jgi:hypothetical protein